MTETEFLTRDRSGSDQPWFQTGNTQLRVVDGVLVLAFLAGFLGLVVLLSR
jgi:hypothetical protein